MTERQEKSARGKLKRTVAGAAPKIAEALGGPLAGAAVAALSKAVFGVSTADAASIDAALTRAGPEDLLALRRAELEFEAALAEAGVETARIGAADRADAREREKTLRDWTPTALGAIIIIGFFATLGAMVLRAIPAGAETEFSIMLGALATMTAAVVNYYFGSSCGSKEKTKLLAATGTEKAHD